MPQDYVPQTNYSYYVCYEWDYGLEGVPVAGTPGTALEAVSVAAPVCYKHVSWVAQAMDSADPQPPDWFTSSNNEVLVHKAISSTFLTDLGDGTTAQTIAGVYIYLLLVPPSDNDQLGIGFPPWDSSLNNILYPSAFFKGLLGAATPDPTGAYGGRKSGQLQKPPG